jgi:hypothetical protein
MEENSLAHLEKLGVEGVLLEMAKGDGRLGRPGSELRADIEYWLNLKRTERDLASSAKRDARELKTLALASRANLIAISAVIIAAIAAHTEIMWLVSSVISWFSK